MSAATARPWEADVSLAREDAARLIETQFPDLVPVRLERIGAGWDNDAYLVNGLWVFRFPRRQIAADLIGREAWALPRLAPHLPLPVPVPVFAGMAETGGYPYPFAGYAHLPGKTACQIAWTEQERAANAVGLARFLAALHAVPVNDETRAAAPGDTIGRTDLARRALQLKERLQALAPVLPELCGQDAGALSALADCLARTPPHAGLTGWVHGDLYARHLLVDNATKTLCGVIDWGDVHVGDPALDLSLAFSFLPPEARPAFRAAYSGALDEAAWDRARFRALWYGAILTLYGGEIGDDALRAAGVYALRSAATG